MSIRRTHQSSDAEKKLKLLQQQIYGKQNTKQNNTKTTYSVNNSGINISTLVKNSISDIAYLKTDLIKIISLSMLAIGAELIIYYLSTKHVINLTVNFIK